MEEYVSIFMSVVEAEQRNGGPQQKRPSADNENPSSRSKKQQGVSQGTKRHKLVNVHPIAVCVDAGAEACREIHP